MNWNIFLAEECPPVKDVLNASELANKWTTCAVGTQCSKIPRHDNGAPKDIFLQELGYQFAHHIKRMAEYRRLEFAPYSVRGYNEQRLQAIKVLAEIEKTSSEILNDIKDGFTL